MEQNLEQLVYYVIGEKGPEEHRDEGLTMLACLLRGQPQVSERMWHLYNFVL